MTTTQVFYITIDSMASEERYKSFYHGVFSHVVSHVLQTTRVDIIKRKMLLNILSKESVNLACNVYGSHIMDKLWEFTAKLTLYKERIARALVLETEKVKNSIYGRQVWKNWKLELYVRKMWDWKKLIKEQEFEIFPNSKPLQPKPEKHSRERNNSKEGSAFKKQKHYR
ncbi:Nucleolar protein 9 [Saccharomyces cerevisiae]|nr:Nucleolar protein 9 [Saccharomyces cerevisiae]